MRKWFIAIAMVMEDKEKISVRQLAKEIKVDKNTAMHMIRRIVESSQEEKVILHQIVQVQNEITLIEE